MSSVYNLMNMDTIELSNLKFRAYHGCLPLERRQGRDYIVDVSISADLSRASGSDNLADTINYAAIYDIVKEEMALPSNLLEHVAGRILTRIREFSDEIKGASVSITKMNPPFDYSPQAIDEGDTRSCVTLSF